MAGSSGSPLLEVLLGRLLDALRPSPLTPEEQNRRHQAEMLEHAREQTRIAQQEHQWRLEERQRQAGQRGSYNPLDFGDR